MWRTAIAGLLLMVGMLTAGQAQASSQCSMFYTVERGDTLYRIARTYNTSVANLQAWNGISNPNRIFAGQMLCVGQQTIIDDTTYTVKRGDTLYRIARNFGINMRVLAEVNNISNVNRIYVGQVLTIPQVTIQPIG